MWREIKTDLLWIYRKDRKEFYKGLFKTIAGAILLLFVLLFLLFWAGAMQG